MNDTISLTDSRGKAFVTVHGYNTEKLRPVADRIRKIQGSRDDSANLNKSIVALISEVNRALKPTPATQDEIIAALESRIVVDCLANTIKALRDPNYYGEAA
jgi:hypothetical protein